MVIGWNQTGDIPRVGGRKLTGYCRRHCHCHRHCNYDGDGYYHCHQHCRHCHYDCYD